MKRTESKTNQTKILVNRSIEKPPALIVKYAVVFLYS